MQPPKLNMIIVSESSAEARRPDRTSQSTTAYSRGSAAFNDTRRHADLRPISVHTEERNRLKISRLLAAGCLRERLRAGRQRGGLGEPLSEVAFCGELVLTG